MLRMFICWIMDRCRMARVLHGAARRSSSPHRNSSAPYKSLINLIHGRFELLRCAVLGPAHCPAVLSGRTERENFSPRLRTQSQFLAPRTPAGSQAVMDSEAHARRGWATETGHPSPVTRRLGVK